MFDITALGEILIDFTPSGTNGMGMPLYAQNPGGAPANVLAQSAYWEAGPPSSVKWGRTVSARFSAPLWSAAVLIPGLW